VRPEFWRGKRVFLTGHTGFKGSWLALWLRHLDAEVTGYALEPQTVPSLFELAGVAGDMESILADVRDVERLSSALQEHHPEIVIHLAAQALVRKSYQNPIETFHTNVLGTAHLLESVRRVPGVRAVVVVTSDKCYENRDWDRGYVEDDALGGYDPYSASKACAELATRAYRNSFFNPNRYSEHGVAIGSARAGNVIGGGDWSADRLVPDIFRSILSEETVRIRNPAATRPWQHVLNPLAGYLTLAEALCEEGPPFAEAWNFGPAETDVRPVSEVVEDILSRWKSNVGWEGDPEVHPHEDRSLQLDATKARHKLGWQPALDLAAALTWTVEWMRAWHRGEDARRITTAQIRRYMEMASR
jgi:CDP-glucose 4,6-dehydratase